MFDVSNVVEEDRSFTPLPPGDYEVIVDDSDFRDTKSGNGRYLHLELSVVSEEGKGRKIFDNLNLENPNPTAVEIAQRQLASLVRACGKVQIKDSSELHNIPIVANITIRPGTNGYDDSNDVKYYRMLRNPAATPASSGTPKDDIPF
tara:strand:+ start:1259 stop:1699 length:441 start_codon:yes stop_codon:yes gene_type:complete